MTAPIDPDFSGTMPQNFPAAMAAARQAGVAQADAAGPPNEGIIVPYPDQPLPHLIPIGPDGGGGWFPYPVLPVDEAGQQVLQPGDVAGIVAGAQAQVASLQQQATEAISAAQATAASDPDGFIAKMQAARDAAKQQLDATIDAAYAELTQIGQQHPEAQSPIIQATQEIAALGQRGVTAISSAFDGAINAATDDIQAAAEAAEAAIVSAASTVADGFESVFSGW
jgi:hypothetical protein